MAPLTRALFLTQFSGLSSGWKPSLLPLPPEGGGFRVSLSPTNPCTLLPWVGQTALSFSVTVCCVPQGLNDSGVLPSWTPLFQLSNLGKVWEKRRSPRRGAGLGAGAAPGAGLCPGVCLCAVNPALPHPLPINALVYRLGCRRMWVTRAAGRAHPRPSLGSAGVQTQASPQPGPQFLHPPPPALRQALCADAGGGRWFIGNLCLALRLL